MSWLRRLTNTFRPGRVDREIRREMAFHLAERVDELRARGYSDDDAWRRARRQFGALSIHAESTRDMDISLLVDGIQRDLRYAVRSLARTPGFTLTVVLTLALGMSANTAVFSAVNAVLLQPLPFPEGDRLMELRQRQHGGAESHIAPVRLEEWRTQNTTFDVISGYFTEDVSETSGDFPARVKRAWVAPRFFEVWGVEPALGRGFSDAEHRLGGPPAIVVSHRYWRDRLGSDPQALTRTVRIGRASVPIVGVMPMTFLFPDRDVDLWTPSPVDAPYARARRNTWYLGIGRLKPGVRLEEARANLTAVQAQLARQYPDPDATIGVDVTPLKETAVGSVRQSLWLLFAGVSVLLLITCTNIAAMLLSRTAHRQHELSVRLSLGASRLTIATQRLIETLVLSMAGGLLGLLVAAASVQVLRAASVDVPRVDEIAIDWRVMVYTLASAVVVALLCAVIPAARGPRGPLAVALHGRERMVVSAGYKWQWLLVGAQVALSVTLLAGAGLLIRSFRELSRADPGFSAEHVLAFRVSGNWGETADQRRLLQRVETMLERLRGLPGVQAAATTGWSLPGVPTQWETTFIIAEGQTDRERHLIAEGRSVSPEYFATLGIPIVAGELCRRHAVNAGGTAPVREVMINREFVRRYLAERPQPPAGLHLAQADAAFRPSRIVGVVGDARERGLDREPGPTVYWCDSAPNPTPYFLVRTRADQVMSATTIRTAIKEIDPTRAVYELGPLDDRISHAYAQNQLRMQLLALFAMGALTLTCIGVYGTLSYAVSTRRREIGVRLALGAVPSRVLRQFVFESLRIVGPACAAGAGLTLASTRLLAGMLNGVSPTDPFTLSLVLVVVVTVAMIAAAGPALRAARLDAARVLRES